MIILLMLSLFTVILIRIFSVVTFAQTPVVLSPGICNWSKVPVHVENPYQSCSAYRVKMDSFTSRCVNENTNPSIFKESSKIARLEQMKLIFTQELLYLSRIPYTASFFEPAWSSFRLRWKKRADENTDLLNVDADPKLGMGKCVLHQMLGRDCGGMPAIDLISLKKEEAIEGAKNMAADFKAEPSLVRDLLKAELTLQAALPSQAAVKRRKNIPASMQFELSEKELLIQNYIENYYPEFHFSSNLRKWLKHWLQASGVSQELSQAINAKEKDSDLSMNEKLGMLKTIALKKITNIEKRRLEKQIENDFQVSFNEILDELADQFEEAQKNPLLALKEDYLLGSAMTVAMNANDREHAGIYQAMICKNALQEANQKQVRNTLLLVGSGLALATGVGAMFDVGIAAVLGTTSLALINTISVYQAIAAYQDASVKRKLYVLHGIDSSDLVESEKEYLESLPWVVLNAVLSSPLLVLKQIGIARSLALAANDLNKAARLNFFRKSVLGITFALNGGIAAYNAKNGYDALQSLLKEKNETFNIKQN